ncbi:hypothetical protein HYC85_015207 [Camellia sinensis]|uniref:Serpin domain-containing protein n=1 Tax=Camellia sinensis TaxID=4442 RepID=A0A7J7GW43_CAMSI|nr:hypothetical protein HYC85_015207 [Camellia sinensis]
MTFTPRNHNCTTATVTATAIAFQNLDRERKLNTFFSGRIGEREKDKHRPKSDLPSSSLSSLTVQLYNPTQKSFFSYSFYVINLLLSFKADKVIDEVNSWVENETKGLIKDLVRPGSINGDTALLFANALYFKGKWDRKFDKKLTRNMKFHLLNGNTVRVPFMTSEKFEHHHLYGSFDGYKILSIPYQSSQFYMYFFLPDDTNGLPRLVKRLNSNPGFMNQEFELCEEEVPELWIPRFKFSFEFEA